MKHLATIITIIAMAVVLPASSVGAESGNELNDLTYGLDFHDLTATFHMGAVIGDWEAGVKVDLPMEENMAGEYILEMIEQICDPEHEAYNPEACDLLTELFTEDVIAAINEQWNIYIETIASQLPSTAHTRQYGWPLNGLGYITLDENDWNWPAVWAPATGEFTLPPIVFPHSFAIGPNGFWLLASGTMAVGTIDPANQSALDGEYIFLTELFFGIRGALVMIGFGHGGPYAGALI